MVFLLVVGHEGGVTLAVGRTRRYSLPLFLRLLDLSCLKKHIRPIIYEM